ncbi:MAG: SH3 domain-containing protein [Thermoflexales bacterium]|nr:SH3 domain-containing protein [Thermoflexales bacterium]MDW8352094.1 SH3 domain-containing protein [Anaerolineae bacterium]
MAESSLVPSISQRRLVTVALAAALGLAACGAPESTPAPTLRIVEPAQGARLTVNVETPLRIEYSGSVSVQVHIWVNGQRMTTLPMQPGGAVASLSWTPQAIGNHVLYLEARDAQDQLVVLSDVIAVNVMPPEPTAVPTAIPTPQPTTEPTAQPSPPTPAEAAAAAVVAPTPTAAATPGITVANDFVNLRAGPGTNYALLGRLNRGQTARVTGKSSDGQWWQINVEGKTVWVFGQFVQANNAAQTVGIAQAPPVPTLVPLMAATESSPVAVAAVAPTASTEPPTATPPPPAEPDCNPSNPHWAAKLNPDAPDYTFCTPVPFEFVPNASPDPDELVIRWHIYGIKSLELRIDPSGDECGMGTRGLRQPVPFKTDNFRLNRRDWPPGGYKIGLFATLHDGRIQDWGELHFCGKG